MPFLSLYTPTYKRPTGLARCLASVAQQTAVADIEQIVIVDHLGIGIDGMYARIPDYAGAVHGDYVHVLADDDELAGPDVVQTVRDCAEANGHPAVILVAVQKGGLVLTSPAWPPVLGGIDLGSMIVRRDVWTALASSWLSRSGIRTPTVRFFGCASRRGTSRVAGRMNVYGPGVDALTRRNEALLICTNWPSWAKSWHISVKWCRSSRCRISRIRSRPSLLPIRHPSAKHESVG